MPAAICYRLLWPRDIFLTFLLLGATGVGALALGAAFLRAARFDFLRSSCESFEVFAIESLFSPMNFQASPRSLTAEC